MSLNVNSYLYCYVTGKVGINLVYMLYINLLSSDMAFIHVYCGQASTNISVRNYTHFDMQCSNAITWVVCTFTGIYSS